MRRAVGPPAVAPFGRMLLMQTWSRLLWFWQIPAWTVSSLAMPVFFFTFFGLRFAARVPSAERIIIFSSLTQGLRPGLSIFRPAGAGVLRQHGLNTLTMVRAGKNFRSYLWL